MSRLTATFAKAKQDKRKLIIPYLMGGDPTAEQTVVLMHGLVEAGADVIELGMPFSDPMADGPVIQAASERVLENGIRLPDVFAMVKTFRKTNSDTPIVLMGYANPIEVMGVEAFAAEAEMVGVDGVITVDMPPEEATELVQAFQKHAIDPIFLLSPTTPEHRVQHVCDQGGGFIYYVSLKGVTGSSKLNTVEVAEKVHMIKSKTEMPVAVGFGITDAESAAAVAQHADAVVVGSVIVKSIAKYADDSEKMLSAVCGLVSDMRNKVDCL